MSCGNKTDGTPYADTTTDPMGSHNMSVDMHSPTLVADNAVHLKDITVLNAWARHAAKGDNSAVYMIIENTGINDTLMSVDSITAAAIELHSAMNNKGMMSMDPVENGILIPAHGTLQLQPGSFHIMLIGLTTELTSGASVPFELTFANAGTVEVNAEIR